MVVESSENEIVGSLLGVASQDELPAVSLCGEVLELDFAAVLKGQDISVLSSVLDGVSLQQNVKLDDCVT